MDVEEARRRLSVAFHLNRAKGQLEIDIPELLAAAGWEDTEANRDEIMEIAMRAARIGMPDAANYGSRRLKITDRGIWIFGRHYWHDAMTKLKGATVICQWEDGDESKILVTKAGAKFTATPAEEA
jgi:hypothetical protein